MAGQTRINGNLIDTGTDPEDIVSISTGDARYPKLDGPNTLTGDLTVDGNIAISGAVDQAKLKEIAESKSDSPVDVFVYDTSRDSDGGAWRKRTQHTSWYNEPLNTATRGSRREFPSVAVIVAETDKVTIYDGDDPALPMWMVFNAVSSKNTLLGFSTSFNSVAITAGDGFIFVASNSGSTFTGGYQQINFLTEVLFRMRHDVKRQSLFNISQRNNGFSDGEAIQTTDQVIASGLANDVAMTVLPGAPIDEATGLPVPTIAVATDGGVSVIKDDGTVVDITDTVYVDYGKVVFTDDGGLLASNRDLSGSYAYLERYDSIPSSDLSNASDYQYVANSSTPTYVRSSSYIDHLLKDAIGSDGGLTLLYENTTTPSEGMVNYITSSYQTGYQNGDIKGAFLSDTDDTDLVEELANTDVSDWSNVGAANWTFTSATELSVDVPSGKGGVARLSLDTTKKYIIEFDLDSFDDNLRVRSDVDNDIITIYQNDGTGSYSVDISFGSSYVELVVYQTDNASLSNVAVRVADRDRSVNNNGLIVNGTVTREPVAPGADLVAYSGFSSTNYLEQPYNPDLDFGTGDFCVMGWFKVGADVDNEGLITRGDNNGGFLIEYRSAQDSILFQTRDPSGVSNNFTPSNSVELDIWYHLACVVTSSGTNHTVYLNGEESYKNISQPARDVTNTSAITRIGRRIANERPFSGSLALWRISATAPTDEQIKRIYEDEKFLFQENAQATLYGNSDAVTALAHDEVTDLLHVGTSDGRSVFQGLRRVDNTTNGVNVIDAHDSMIIEG